MKNGILKTLLYYGIGFGIGGIAFLNVKKHYAHAPGLHHLIMFLTMVIGIVWTLVALVMYFRKRTKNLAGILIGHISIILVIVLYMTYEYYRFPN